MVLRNGVLEEVGMSKEGISRAEKVAQRLVESGNSPAIVTLIARNGVIVSHKAFGKHGPEADSPDLKVDALFPVCSITKPITATLVMMLVEEGLVGLNRPVEDYIPEFTGEGKKEICVHHLLTHTSGMRDEDVEAHCENKKGAVQFPPCDSTQVQQIHERLYLGYDAPMRDKPGKVMSYFNFGYMLLGEIVRRVSGMSFDAFATERLFEPLGMKDTYLVVPDSVRDRIVRRGEDAIFHEWLMAEELLKSPSSAGGLFTTAMDLAIFSRMFQNKGIYNGKRIISPVTVAEMTKNHIPGVAAEYRDEFFPEASWGYGWSINGSKKDGGDLFSPLAYSHWGAAGVFFCVDPVYDTIQVYLSVEIDHNKSCRNIYADAFNNAALSAVESL